MIIRLDQISVGDRYRKDYGDLTGLKQSLEAIGTIHPPVLSRETEITGNGLPVFRLVAGGRRLKALTELNVKELHHGSVLDPQRFGFLFADEVPEDQRKQAELEENLYRLGTKWHEDVLNIADVHLLKKEKDVKWGYKQTADLLGPGYGRTNVNNAVRLAKLIRKGDKEIISCDTMADAIALMVKRKEDAALAELQRLAMPSRTNLTSFLETLSIDLGGKKGPAMAATEQPITPLPGSIPGGPVTIPLRQMFMLGDFRTILPKLPNGCFDHIVTDIPYGIDLENLDTWSNIEDVEKEHEVIKNVEQMEPFLVESFRLVSSGGFCVFFYDLDWHEYLQATAEKIGWKIQRWPYIACKSSACRNSAAQYNTTKNYECAMFLRRDEKTVLRKQVPSSWGMYDFAAERRLYNNPFAKPFNLWKDLYDIVAFKGQKILDPFVGEMSSSRAAINCGLVPFGIEINPKHFNRGLEHVKAAYALVHGTDTKFI